jgi:glycosyltransferase involved in cell wall biosynthesis
MVTFGLIHRNKNIQLALQAMQGVVKSVPNIMYLFIGQTHPLILKYEGEVYRRELEANVTVLGLANHVRFINKFVDNNELLSYLTASDIFLTAYAREDQYVSGTICEGIISQWSWFLGSVQ